MPHLSKLPSRYRWMQATTIIALLAAIADSVCQSMHTRYRTNLWQNLDELQATHPGIYPIFDIPGYSEQLDQLNHFEKVLSCWMLLLTLISFLSILLFFVFAMRDQFRLTHIRGGIAYTLIALSILLPAVVFVGRVISKNESLTTISHAVPIAMALIQLIMLVVLFYTDWPSNAPSPMFSPWIGIPGYIALFFLGAPRYVDISGFISSSSEEGLAQIFAFLQGVTVFLMAVDTAIYRIALWRQKRQSQSV